MPNLRLKVSAIGGLKSYRKAFRRQYGFIEEAASFGLDDVGTDIKNQGRLSIASAGFSKRWQNALRVTRYPRRETSVNAALDIRHKVPYAGVFEYGATIKGKPFLWVPAKGVPRKRGRNTVTPSYFHRNIAPLRAINVRGRPYLVANVATGRGRRRKNKRTGGSIAQRPNIIFIGVRQADHKKKFDVSGAVRRGELKFATYYTQRLRRSGANR